MAVDDEETRISSLALLDLVADPDGDRVQNVARQRRR
jgi:hypothetical protein